MGPKPYYRFDDKTRPDVWFEPAQVWEVKAADYSLSPIYPAAKGLVRGRLTHRWTRRAASRSASPGSSACVPTRRPKPARRPNLYFCVANVQLAELFRQQAAVNASLKDIDEDEEY